MSVTFVEKSEIKKIIKSKVKAADIILDIGCGITPQSLIRPKIHICLEPCGEYIDYLRKHRRGENSVLLQSGWKETIDIFPDRSIDSIFLLDFIEHLEKEEGKILLRKCENIARKQIIVYTPLGFVPQIHMEGRKDRWGMNGGKWQKHKSGWYIEDFDDSWDLTCAKEYHFDDGYGNVYDKPFSVIWAIKNIQWNDDIVKERLFILLLKKLIPSSAKHTLKNIYINIFSQKSR